MSRIRFVCIGNRWLYIMVFLYCGRRWTSVLSSYYVLFNPRQRWKCGQERFYMHVKTHLRTHWLIWKNKTTLSVLKLEYYRKCWCHGSLSRASSAMELSMQDKMPESTVRNVFEIIVHSYLMLYYILADLHFFLFFLKYNSYESFYFYVNSWWRSGARFIKTYDVIIQRYCKSHTEMKVSKMHILRCMGSTFCVKFQRCPLKFHTKLWTHTLQNMHFARCLNFDEYHILELWYLKPSEMGPREAHSEIISDTTKQSFRVQEIMSCNSLNLIDTIKMWLLWFTIHTLAKQNDHHDIDS